MKQSTVPPIVKHLSESVVKASKIEPGLFEKYSVKRGLRNADHSGVLVGLTNVGDVVGYQKTGDVLEPIDGKLIYRGINVEALVQGAIDQNRHGFDEVVYLLLSGKLPNKQELEEFMQYMGHLRDLPDDFTNNTILANKGQNVMNILARTVLGLYNLDKDAEDTSPEKPGKPVVEPDSQISNHHCLFLSCFAPLLSAQDLVDTSPKSKPQHSGELSADDERGR